MSIGIKELYNTVSDYDEIIVKLSDSDGNFHTYPVKDQKLFKLIYLDYSELQAKQ